MEQAVCSETLAYKIQMPGNYPEESIQHSEHGESLKSRIRDMIKETLSIEAYFLHHLGSLLPTLFCIFPHLAFLFFVSDAFICLYLIPSLLKFTYPYVILI
jgi:hypothetical protein